MLCSTRSMLSTGSAHGSATDAALELLEEWEQLLLPMAPLGWDDDDDEDEDEDLLDDEEDLDLGDEEDEEFFDDDDEDLDEDEEDLLDDE